MFARYMLHNVQKGRIPMSILRLKYLGVFLVLLVFFSVVRASDQVRLPDKDGTLIVLVTWGDVDNTPANDVYIEEIGRAHV